MVYRVAVRALRELPDGLQTVAAAVRAWREGTRAALLRRNDIADKLAHRIVDEVPFLTTRLVSNVDSMDGETSKLLKIGRAHAWLEVRRVLFRS